MTPQQDSDDELFSIPPPGSDAPPVKPHLSAPFPSNFPFYYGSSFIENNKQLERHKKLYKVIHGRKRLRRRSPIIRRKDLKNPAGLLGQRVSLLCRLIEVRRAKLNRNMQGFTITMYAQDRFGILIRIMIKRTFSLQLQDGSKEAMIVHADEAGVWRSNGPREMQEIHSCTRNVLRTSRFAPAGSIRAFPV